MLFETVYNLVLKFKRYVLEPQDSVTILPQGKWISARASELNYEGKTTRQVQLYLDDKTEEQFKKLFDDIYEQYQALGGESQPYQFIKEYQGQKNVNLKITDSTTFFQYNVQTKEIETIPWNQINQSFDCFATVRLNPWDLKIKDEPTFGVSFNASEVVVAPSTRSYTKRKVPDNGVSIADLFKSAKKEKPSKKD